MLWRGGWFDSASGHHSNQSVLKNDTDAKCPMFIGQRSAVLIRSKTTSVSAQEISTAG
jgi:hypothetical protein